MRPFITAYRKVHAVSPETHEKLKGLLSGLEAHIKTAGLGHISALADADPPHNPGGCIAQAWSVAELLRAIVEDILQIAPELSRMQIRARSPKPAENDSRDALVQCY